MGVGDDFALNEVDIVDIQGKHLAILLDDCVNGVNFHVEYYHSKLNN